MAREQGIGFRSLLASRQTTRLSDGVSATFTVWEEDGTYDTHGDANYSKTEYEITVVPSRVTNTREPFDRRGELGHYLNMHMEFFTTDTIPTDNTAVDKPPTLTHKGHEYQVLEIEDSQIGIIRMLVYRKRV